MGAKTYDIFYGDSMGFHGFSQQKGPSVILHRSACKIPIPCCLHGNFTYFRPVEFRGTWNRDRFSAGSQAYLTTYITIRVKKRNCTNHRNHNQNREDFSLSRRWPWAYFLNGPNAAASIAPTLIWHCLQLCQMLTEFQNYFTFRLSSKQACNHRQQGRLRCCHLVNSIKQLRPRYWPISASNYVKTWRHLQNRKYITYSTVVRGRQSRGHSKMYRKFREIWTCGLEIRERTDRQTDGQTDRHADCNTLPTYRGRSHHWRWRSHYTLTVSLHYLMKYYLTMSNSSVFCTTVWYWRTLQIASLVKVNEVDLRSDAEPGQYWDGWPSGFDSRGGTLFRYVTNHPGRLSLLPSVPAKGRWCSAAGE